MLRGARTLAYQYDMSRVLRSVRRAYGLPHDVFDHRVTDFGMLVVGEKLNGLELPVGATRWVVRSHDGWATQRVAPTLHLVDSENTYESTGNRQWRP